MVLIANALGSELGVGGKNSIHYVIFPTINTQAAVVQLRGTAGQTRTNYSRTKRLQTELTAVDGVDNVLRTTSACRESRRGRWLASSLIENPPPSHEAATALRP